MRTRFLLILPLLAAACATEADDRVAVGYTCKVFRGDDVATKL